MKLLTKIITTSGASLTGLILNLFSPRILATIIVLSTEKFVKKSKWEWDDKLLKRIKEEWRIEDEN